MKTLVTRLIVVVLAASALSGCIIIDRSGEHSEHHHADRDHDHDQH